VRANRRSGAENRHRWKTREGKLIFELLMQEPTAMAKIKWETPPKQTGETRSSKDKVNPHQDKGTCKPNIRVDFEREN
jgi:hypothetical protein